MAEQKSTTKQVEYDPDISLENGRRLSKQAEKADPKFKSTMDKLRKAAKLVMKAIAFMLMGFVFSKRVA